MTLSVLISIQSSAYRDDSTEVEALQLLVPGEMELSDDKRTAVLRYEETIDKDVPPQQVTVTVTDDSITVDRDGEYASLLFFKNANSFQTVYHTPVGDMDVAVYCTYLKIQLDEYGGTLAMRYQLDLNNQFAAMHETEMTIASAMNSGLTE